MDSIKKLDEVQELIKRLRNNKVTLGHGEYDVDPLCELAANELDKATNEIERLRTVLDLYRDAVRIDVTMEGPKFMGANSSALKRAWDADLATLGDHNEKGN